MKIFIRENCVRFIEFFFEFNKEDINGKFLLAIGFTINLTFIFDKFIKFTIKDGDEHLLLYINVHF